MLELGEQLRTWCTEATSFTLATVVARCAGSAAPARARPWQCTPNGGDRQRLGWVAWKARSDELASSLLPTGTATLATYGSAMTRPSRSV